MSAQRDADAGPQWVGRVRVAIQHCFAALLGWNSNFPFDKIGWLIPPGADSDQDDDLRKLTFEGVHKGKESLLKLQRRLVDQKLRLNVYKSGEPNAYGLYWVSSACCFCLLCCLQVSNKGENQMVADCGSCLGL